MPPPEYPPLNSPANVLDALGKAYAAKDSNEYKVLYDVSYQGTSQDINDPPGTLVSTYRYADEVMHIAALARSTTVTKVFFDIGLYSTWQRLPSSDLSHPEWAEIQINNTLIRIDDGSTTYEVNSHNPVTFTFIPHAVAPGDTTWKIVRWNEVGSSA